MHGYSGAPKDRVGQKPGRGNARENAYGGKEQHADRASWIFTPLRSTWSRTSRPWGIAGDYEEVVKHRLLRAIACWGRGKILLCFRVVTQVRRSVICTLVEVLNPSGRGEAR